MKDNKSAPIYYMGNRYLCKECGELLVRGSHAFDNAGHSADWAECPSCGKVSSAFLLNPEAFVRWLETNAVRESTFAPGRAFTLEKAKKAIDTALNLYGEELEVGDEFCTIFDDGVLIINISEEGTMNTHFILGEPLFALEKIGFKAGDASNEGANG